MLSLCRGKLPVVSALFTTLNWGMVEGGGALTLHNWLEWSQGLCPGLQLELAGGGGGRRMRQCLEALGMDQVAWILVTGYLSTGSG
jgi:hypothetical protein